ncbi:uncharacterized protein LOC130800980 [Amaranthus tricolor]|uniref:uncharacterized protein LOC130800980 n=1 Tax=Amaranthus tricolor TaxID=29722 RepID=UPI002584BCF7|nr:uncharacterized protein LOC130800980 [Amaranthus tricolor]
MNLDAQRIRLIDFSLEDDFLIDSDLNGTSFDLRLSVAFETQNELLSSPKSRFHPEMTDRQSFFAEKVPNAIKECNARKSLAWDREFFTSPGFLELEELSRVNRGFKNLKACASTHGTEDNVRSKICEERKLRQKTGAVVGCRNKILVGVLDWFD